MKLCNVLSNKNIAVGILVFRDGVLKGFKARKDIPEKKVKRCLKILMEECLHLFYHTKIFVIQQMERLKSSLIIQIWRKYVIIERLIYVIIIVDL